MSKVDLFTTDVHQSSVADADGTSGAGAPGFLDALAVAVTFMLLGFAAEFVWKHVPRPVVAVLGALVVAAGVAAAAVR